jgi:hypothetical protein
MPGREQPRAGCGKVPYWTRASAVIALWKTGDRRRDTGKEESRLYQCPLCPGRPYHLTSQKKK